MPFLRSMIRSGWTTVLLIALASAVAQAFGRFTYGILLPAVRDDMGITNTEAGLIGAANVGAYLLGTMLVAWATNRYLLLNVMRLGLIMTTLGLLLASVASSPLFLTMALFVAGLGGAFLWIPAPVIASAALPIARQPLAVGLMSSGIGLGVVFASILSGVLRSSEGDHAWSSVYQVLFYIALLILAATLLIVRHAQARPRGGGGIGGFGALRRMHRWLPLIMAYATFGFMYLLVIGFLTISHRVGVRLALSIAFGLWPLLVWVVLTGFYLPTLAACLGLGLLFSALPTLMTIYVVENTTAQDYGPSFAAATLTFGIAQTISPPIGGFIADLSGSFTLVFLLSSVMGVVGLMASLRLPKHNREKAC